MRPIKQVTVVVVVPSPNCETSERLTFTSGRRWFRADGPFVTLVSVLFEGGVGEQSLLELGLI